MQSGHLTQQSREQRSGGLLVEICEYAGARVAPRLDPPRRTGAPAARGEATAHVDERPQRTGCSHVVGVTSPEGNHLGVAAARTGDPALVFEPVVLSSRAVTIALPYTAADGTAKTALVAGTIDLTGAPVAVFDLPGPQVIQAYEALTHPDVPLVVTVTTSYACWQETPHRR